MDVHQGGGALTFYSVFIDSLRGIVVYYDNEKALPKQPDSASRPHSGARSLFQDGDGQRCTVEVVVCRALERVRQTQHARVVPLEARDLNPSGQTYA